MRSVVTRRLVLRPWTVADRDVWRRLNTERRILTFIDDGSAPSADEVNDRLRHAVRWQDGPGIFACERLDEPGDPIGMVGFAPPSFLPELLPIYEIGWRLLPEHWGNGFATEAATSALAWAFENDLFERVVACVQPDNRASVAVAERLGMAPSHRTVIPSCARWTDVYEMTSERWER